MFKISFKKEIPCKKGACKYEYGMTNRDIEGMPFSKDDKDDRKCPKYGHVCPAFMKECGFTVEDLKVRATIHCGFTAKEMLEKGEWKLEEMGEMAEQIKNLLARYEDVLRKYPQEQYPKYYNWQT